MQKDTEEEWKDFFLNKHLKDVMDTGYFTSYAFRKEIKQKNQDSVTFIAEYSCKDLDSLSAYNKQEAPRLKQEVIEKFGGKFEAERVIYKVLKTTGVEYN